MSWTDERVELLKKMWGARANRPARSPKELGGVTRNAVIGKVHRLGLSNRAGSGPASAAKPAPAKEAEAKTADKPRKEAAKTGPADLEQPAGVSEPETPATPARATNVTPLRKPIVPAGQPPAAATLGQRDQPRGAGQGAGGRKDRQAHQPDGTDRADLQMAHR